MRLLLIILTFSTMVSCTFSTKSKISSEIITDTVLIKIENKIDKSYEIGFYKKSFIYCWVTGNDTLDFKIGLTEHERDGSVNLRIFHQNPILFSDALAKINEGLPLIEQDFNLDNLRGLYFEVPIFYKDLSTELSKTYKMEFGAEHIKFQELNAFLKNSWLDKKLKIFLEPFNKTTKRYSVEKFHLLNKENYGNYIPNENLNDYPSFSIHGIGISVDLVEEK